MSKQHMPTKAELYGRSLVFWVFHALTVFLVVGVLLMFFWLPINKRYAIASSWAKMNINFLKFSCNLDYQIKGKENIPDEASLVLSNHQSTWETLMLPPHTWRPPTVSCRAWTCSPIPVLFTIPTRAS